MNDIYLSWLAGLIDGDGCFSFGITRRKSGAVSFGPQVRVAGAEKDTKFYESIKEELNIGKIYFSNKGKEDGICSWQMVGADETYKFCKIIISYLHIKKENCQKLIETIDLMRKTSKGRGKKRSYTEVLSIVKKSMDINARRQTNRWRNSQNRNIDYWESYLKNYYL